MEKRLPLALLLCLAFFLAWSALFGPELEERVPLAGEPAGAAGGAAVDGGAPPGDLAVAPPSVEPPPEPARPVPFAGPGYTATFTTRGGGLEHMELLDYKASVKRDEPLEVLGAVDPTRPSLLLRTATGEHALDRVSWDVREATTPDGRAQLVFEHVTADGLRFRRTVTAAEDPYLFELEITVENAGEAAAGTLALVLEGARGVVDEATSRIASTPPAALAITAGPDGTTLTDWTGDDLAEGPPRAIAASERLVATGSVTNYFAALLVPEEGTFVQQVVPRPVLDLGRLEHAVERGAHGDPARAERLRRELAGEFEGNAAVELVVQRTMPEPGQSVAFRFDVFAGPRERKLVDSPAYAFLRPIIERSYGSWRSLDWINKTMLAVLGFFHGLVGNWGVAIILLTILVKGLLFPLNRVQQNSMARYNAALQKLKPEIDALKERYKNNQRKFGEEQMKLLREHRVRPPLGGCLLMFVQLPIWFALFQILRSSIELRHAGFVLWIEDLSQPDAMPFGLFEVETVNLLPILMAVAMFLQMRFAPQSAAADEQARQMQKIMGLLMPGMMLFFLYGYSSGLSLYIFVSSLLGIFEYQVIRRFWPPPTAATIRLERRKPPARARAH